MDAPRSLRGTWSYSETIAVNRRPEVETDPDGGISPGKERALAERDTEQERESRAATVKRIRRLLRRTQAELATALGTSTKAIQSYEQGWRKVPTQILIQLLVLLALDRRRKVDRAPCWEIMSCPPERREPCPSFATSDGLFCWFVSSRVGCGRSDGSEEDLLPCISCPVVRRLMSVWDTD